MKKILTVVGARPQFIKAAAVSRVIRESYSDKVEEIIVHTGQHFDHNMSKVFFEELDIPTPKYNLDISGGGHGVMTGRMLEAIEKVLEEERPDCLLIYGDTNSTLAGALAASKLHIPIAHVEAGLRSFNMRMPEEINRIVSDRVSSLLFCPTDVAVDNLAREGIVSGVHNVGDVMFDASLFYRELAVQRSRCLEDLKLNDDGYVLATCHRAENTDDPARLSGIVEALIEISRGMPVVFPLHPRTKKLLMQRDDIVGLDKLTLIDPLPFLDMIRLERSAHAIITDSGGVQKEAYFFGVPCLTTRDETEWVETVSSGWNKLVGADFDLICDAYKALEKPSSHPLLYGDGHASKHILEQLVKSV